MNTIEGKNGGRVESPSEKLAREIRGWDNGDIRELVTSLGLVSAEGTISESDYEATKNRAEILAKGKEGEPEDFLIPAFIDRMQSMGRISQEDIKSLSDEILKRIIFIETGFSMTSEEVALCRKSDVALLDWVKSRTAAKDAIKDFDVAVDKNEIVGGVGTSPEEAVRNAKSI